MGISVTKAATELGMDAEGLKRKFAEAGIEYKKRQHVTWRQVFIALQGGDAKEHKARFEAAKADYMYMEMLEREGFLIPKNVIHELWTAALVPIRERLLALPAAYASRCNPADPDHASAVLEQWVADTMRSLQDELRQVEAGRESGSGENQVRKKKPRTRARVAGTQRKSVRTGKRA